MIRNKRFSRCLSICKQFISYAFLLDFSKVMIMGKILFVGDCCLDLVIYLPSFPEEDSDMRNVDQLFTLGGNAVSLFLLIHFFDIWPDFRHLDKQCQSGCPEPGSVLLFSVIPDGNALFDGLFSKYGLDTSFCVQRTDDDAYGVPISVCLINAQNGSRTTFSTNNKKRWPNGGANLGDRLTTLDGFSWFHFETGYTKDFDAIIQMVRHVHTLRSRDPSSSDVTISIEFEHPVEENAQLALISMADVIFVSKDFARLNGWHSMEECAEHFQDRFGAQHATIICPWGEKGVAAKPGTSVRLPASDSSGLVSVPAHAPSSGAVVDTLAAGDCFIAGAVHFLNAGAGLRAALTRAGFLAGESVGQRGLADLPKPS